MTNANSMDSCEDKEPFFYSVSKGSRQASNQLIAFVQLASQISISASLDIFNEPVAQSPENLPQTTTP